MSVPYYDDGVVQLWHGDCFEHRAWLSADVLMTDPPFGRAWKQGRLRARPGWHGESVANPGIAGDLGTGTRDDALYLWGVTRPALMFGDLMLPPPPGTVLVGVYRKPPDAGMRGAKGGVRRDLEALHLIGPWANGMGGRSALFTTAAATVGNPSGIAARAGGHPHAKPLDLLEELLTDVVPPGVVADPFAGAGSTLLAARALGRRAVGVELEERWCEAAARRLAADVLPLGM